VRTYLDHLSNNPPETEGWADKANELFGDLLHALATYLNYDFDKVHLNRACYSPRAHGNLENDLDAIRKGAVELLAGKTALPVTVIQLPIDPGNAVTHQSGQQKN
jgi:hypothetical protein